MPRNIKVGSSTLTSTLSDTVTPSAHMKSLPRSVAVVPHFSHAKWTSVMKLNGFDIIKDFRHVFFLILSEIFWLARKISNFRQMSTLTMKYADFTIRLFAFPQKSSHSISTFALIRPRDLIVFPSVYQRDIKQMAFKMAFIDRRRLQAGQMTFTCRQWFSTWRRWRR